MSDQKQARAVYQFGHFEAAQETGELYRLGRRVKIQELPFRALIALLEQRGEIVSRDVLAKQLWPDNSFVEFDQGLSVAMTKLRQAIGDVAENPRFIETVPRRGYRFIAPVTVKSQVVEAPATTPIISAAVSIEAMSLPEAAGPVVVEAEPVAGEVKPDVQPTSRPARLYRWTAAAAVLALASSAAFLLRTHAPVSTALRENDRIVLTDFDNATADGIFDDTLSSALRVKLDESPFLSLVSRGAGQSAMEKLGVGSGFMSVKDAQQICQAVHAQAIIHGLLSPARGGVRLRLQADACGTAKTLAEEEVFSSSRELLLSSLGELADRLRRDLGEPENSVQRFGTPLVQATTASFSALKAFAIGEEKRARGQDHETIADYKLATDLDPEFALAYARLGVIYGNENEAELAHAAYQKAFDFRAHTTERERLYLTAHYYGSVTGDLDRAEEVYQLWRQLYPHDLIAPNNLADTYETLGKPEQARSMAQAALHINPENAFPYSGLLQADQRLGRYDEARLVWREVLTRKLGDNVISRMAMLRIGFAQGDDGLVAEQMKWATGNPREGEFLLLMGWIRAALGHLREAKTTFHSAQDIALRNGLNEFAAEVGEDLAQFEVDFGESREARAEVQHSLKLAPGEPNVEAFAAMILAGAGDTKQAEALSLEVQRAAPQDTVFNKIVLPMAASRLALARSDPQAAVEQLKPVATYDLSRVTELATIYYRAQALLAAGQGLEAAKEFQRLLALRAVCPISPYLALAHLGIARSRAFTGDQEGARAEYAVFLQEWKDADSDIPVVRQARLEFNHLPAPR